MVGKRGREGTRGGRRFIRSWRGGESGAAACRAAEARPHPKRSLRHDASDPFLRTALAQKTSSAACIEPQRL